MIRWELSPTGSDTECSWFLCSSGCNGSRYYQAAHGMELIPNETQLSCRILAGCLVQKQLWGRRTPLQQARGPMWTWLYPVENGPYGFKVRAPTSVSAGSVRAG